MKIDELAYKTVSDKQKLIPVVVQDYVNREVLMVAYANAEALNETVRTGFAHYWSRSRQELWKKGGTSGNVQKIIEILVDCDEDTLLYLVDQTGPACHTGKRTCFYRQLHESNAVRKKFDRTVIRQIIQAYSQSTVVERRWHRGGSRRVYRYLVDPLTVNTPPPNPLWLEWIANMVHQHTPNDIDKVLTVESFGIPIAQLIADLKGKPLAIIRKRSLHDSSKLLAKTSYASGFEHGTYWVYGVSEGERVLLIDDTISTGGTLAPLVSLLKKQGVTVTDVFCVVEKPEYRGVKYVKKATGILVKTLFRVHTRSRRCVPTKYAAR
jgi:phosphoribosyl-AMP cyclohydrolase/adenine/guanine phosphoribosyltransferase-like PRPP-binding protein